MTKGTKFLTAPWLCMIILGAATSIPANDSDSSLEFRGHYWLRYYTDMEEESDTENTSEFRNDVRVELRRAIREDGQIVFSVDGDVDRVENNLYDRKSEKETLEVWEAYLKWRLTSADLWVGKQVIRWGKSDEINPTDNFTPEDFSEFINEDRIDRKVPAWMLRGCWYGESLTYEIVFQPIFEPSEIMGRGSDWRLQGLRDLEALGVPIVEDELEDELENYVFANRLIYRGDDFDAGISYARHFNQTPGLRMTPTAAVLEYHRQNSVGAEFEFVLGPVGVRGECVYTTDEPIPTHLDLDPDGVELRDGFHLVAGGDYTTGLDIYVNLQYALDAIMDYSSVLNGEEFAHSIIGTVSRKFLHEELEVGVNGRYYFDPEGHYVSPYVDYRLNDHATVGVMAAWYGGEDGSLMGQFDNNDQVGVDFKLVF